VSDRVGSVVRIGGKVLWLPGEWVPGPGAVKYGHVALDAWHDDEEGSES
jgi:hypothetical protein